MCAEPIAARDTNEKKRTPLRDVSQITGISPILQGLDAR